MHVIYYQSPTGNFGDDLNAVLWRALLPESCFADDDAVLLGIGSIFREDFLSEAATRGKRVFVLGSGAGTGQLPKLWPNEQWSILAVRGPLTGQLIGRPGAVATDSAALLAVAPSLAPTPVERREVAFFPHYNSVEYSQWPRVCELAGMTFVDAHRPPGEILSTLAGARLVVTEAMHGAILADTLRIPWVPVVCSPSILPFKWVDWAQSLELDYRPTVLPPSSAWEALKHLRIRIDDPRHARNGSASGEGEDLIADFRRRFTDVPVEDLVVKPRLNGGARSTVQKATTLFDRIFVERAAQALISIAEGRAYLSADRVFADRVERLQEAVRQLRSALGA
jgi:succinoglycan biosynthesis protein ExoV